MLAVGPAGQPASWIKQQAAAAQQSLLCSCSSPSLNLNCLLFCRVFNSCFNGRVVLALRSGARRYIACEIISRRDTTSIVSLPPPCGSRPRSAAMRCPSWPVRIVKLPQSLFCHMEHGCVLLHIFQSQKIQNRRDRIPAAATQPHLSAWPPQCL